MRTLIFIVVVVITVGALVVDAQRGRGRGGRGRGGGRPRGLPRPTLSGLPPFNFSTWDREVDGENVTQKGLFMQKDNKSVVTVFTKPQAILRNLSLAPSAVLYDFSDAAIVVAVKIGKGRRSSCYLVNGVSGLAFDTAAQELETRNLTLVSASLTDVQLNGTEEPLTWDEARDLVAETPSLGRLCRGSKIFNTTTADAATFPVSGAEDEGERVVAAIGLDSKISILTTIPPPRPTTFPGRGGRGGRPGGRGGRPGGRPGGRGGRGRN